MPPYSIDRIRRGNIRIGTEICVDRIDTEICFDRIIPPPDENIRLEIPNRIKFLEAQ